MKAVSVSDYRERARRRLPHFLFEYIDGGSYGEVTLRRNIEDLERIALRQRVLRDVSKVDLSTELFGETLKMPVVLGPVGLAGLNARRGETQAIRAAQAAGAQFCLSTVSACSLDVVEQASTRSFWFQLYVPRDRAFLRDLLAKVREHACSALVLTVDIAVPGSRYRDHRSGLAGATGPLGVARRACGSRSSGRGGRGMSASWAGRTAWAISRPFWARMRSCNISWPGWAPISIRRCPGRTSILSAASGRGR